jgi:hypothetical protein
VAFGVEHDSVFGRAGLEVGDRCSAFGGPGDSGVEVVDGQVQVDGGGLFAGGGRPDGPAVVGLVVEVERGGGDTVRRADQGPAGVRRFSGSGLFVAEVRPVEQPGVEPSEFARSFRRDRQGAEANSSLHPFTVVDRWGQMKVRRAECARDDDGCGWVWALKSE